MVKKHRMNNASISKRRIKESRRVVEDVNGVTFDEFDEMDFDEQIDFLENNGLEISSYELMKENAIYYINEDNIGYAYEILGAIWNDTSEAEHYVSDAYGHFRPLDVYAEFEKLSD